MRLPALTIFLTALLIPAIPHAQSKSFKEQFIESYRNRDLKRLESLVVSHKDTLLSEAEALVEEALAKDKGFEERMFLLDIASSMVTMYRFRFKGGRDLLERINRIIKTESEKERKRLLEAMRWSREEEFLGNFVMRRYEKEMAERGLPPVIYPHWIHRIWFQCKVCHNKIFVMKRWVNEITQEKIEKGRLCGVCHNGKIAFDARSNCRRCHLAGRPEAERLREPDRLDHEKVQKIARQLGAEWNYKKLPEGRIPRDRFGFIDWLELKRRGVFKPIPSLEGKDEEGIRDNKILFITKGKSVQNVLFDHKIHSSWIRCSVCHPLIFKDKLGENDIWMKDMARGQFCGHCHGKVSFTFADCMRCHSQPRDTIPPGVLVHRPKRKGG